MSIQPAIRSWLLAASVRRLISALQQWAFTSTTLSRSCLRTAPQMMDHWIGTFRMESRSAQTGPLQNSSSHTYRQPCKQSNKCTHHQSMTMPKTTVSPVSCVFSRNTMKSYPRQRATCYFSRSWVRYLCRVILARIRPSLSSSWTSMRAHQRRFDHTWARSQLYASCSWQMVAVGRTLMNHSRCSQQNS